MYIIINERERERRERDRILRCIGRRIADEGVYEILTCSKLNADRKTSSRSAFDVEQVSILCRIREHSIVQVSIRIPHLRYDRYPNADLYNGMLTYST